MNHLIVDYLTISFKFTGDFKAKILDGLTDKDIIQMSTNFSIYFREWMIEKLSLPKDDIQLIRSRYGYGECIYYDGISLHIDSDMMILEMSGRGCRACEDLNKNWDWYLFLLSFDDMICYSNENFDVAPIHIARMDIAYDDIGNKIVTVPLLHRYIKAGKYVCISRYVSCISGTMESDIYFGSPKSDRRLRIYDKRLEQRGLDSDVPWVRYEFQLRNKNALSFYLNLKKCKGDFSKCYFGVLSNYLVFTSESKNDKGHHTDRLTPVKWWTSLIGNVLKLKQLYLPGREYTVNSITHFFNVQCLSAAKSVLMLELMKNNGDCSSFIDMISKAVLNDKQQRALDNYKYELSKDKL